MNDEDQTTKTLDALKQVISIAPTLHLDVAADVWPDGGRLRCVECGHEKRFTRDQAVGYLRGGWPRCCGYTMRAI